MMEKKKAATGCASPSKTSSRWRDEGGHKGVEARPHATQREERKGCLVNRATGKRFSLGAMPPTSS